jgi:hypothetical protein
VQVIESTALLQQLVRCVHSELRSAKARKAPSWFFMTAWAARQAIALCLGTEAPCGAPSCREH